jgi:heme/copper-type cytochrome/quinol oxidase subunit 3
MNKIKQNIYKTSQCTKETLKLLWQFKWYIAFDFIIFTLLLSEYFNPPAADDMIWKSEAINGMWNYQNQQVYMQSCKYGLIISVLLFLIGTSNMRNHPLLAKLIFLFPLYIGWFGIL